MIIKVLHTISHRLHTVVVVRLAVVVVVYKAATAAGSTCLKIYRIMFILKKNNIMLKKNIYIPIKAVPYIFVSIAAITIAATTNIII